ncbi:MAG: hypothetical protein ACI4TB_03120 [Lachnospiraceae bacterium]
MSEKGTSQNKDTQKIVTKYDRKVQRRKEEELKAQKQKKINRIVGIVVAAVIVIGLVSVPVRKFIATHSTYITVGGHDITQAEFDYYYNMAASDYINTYGSYLSYMGLDIYGDFASQAYSDTMSWKDYFEQLAVDSIRQNKALVDAAAAEGFTYDPSAEYEQFAQAVKDAASEASMTLGKYYKATFGQYATVSNIKSYIEEGYLATAYYKAVAESKEPSVEEIQAYYNENTASYDSVDFLLTEVAAEIPEAQAGTDADGNATTVEPTEEEIQAAMDAAKEQADAALEVIAEEGTAQTGKLKSSISYRYSDWLFDEARAEGDTTIVEDTDNHKYYVLMFQKRYLDESATATVRAIMTTTGNGDVILTEWEAAGGTEDAFISMVEKYSEDTSTNTSGGLYEELKKSSIDSTLGDWIFSTDRKAGDTVTITEDTYTYVFYYIAAGRPEWQVKIKDTLLSDTMNEYLTALKDACEVSDPKGHLVYLKPVETETESSAAETTAE